MKNLNQCAFWGFFVNFIHFIHEHVGVLNIFVLTFVILTHFGLRLVSLKEKSQDVVIPLAALSSRVVSYFHENFDVWHLPGSHSYLQTLLPIALSVQEINQSKNWPTQIFTSPKITRSKKDNFNETFQASTHHDLEFWFILTFTINKTCIETFSIAIG